MMFMSSRIRDRAGPGAVTMSWGWEISTPPAPSARLTAARTTLSIAAYTVVALVAAALVGFFVFVYSIDRIERNPAARTDAIVALTGGAQRIGDAIDLLGKGYGSRLLITGVNERTSRDEIARLNPGQRRLFDCCVDLDYRARNTIGNAIETRRWAEQNRFRSVIVVTSNYHMPRTLVELDHALPGIRKVPYAVVTPTVDPDLWWRSPATAKVLASEYVKLLVVWLRTRFESDPERSTAAIVMSGGLPIKAVVDPVTR
jgi:uncharacterized SAM-binding protein YcdF (DUF218 family)